MTRQTPDNSGDLGEKRVRNFAARHFGITPENVVLNGLTPDASTRKYYRIANRMRPDETFIVSLYPAPFNPHDNTFINVTDLLRQAQLPVPLILGIAGTEGIILQEDLGDHSLAQWTSRWCRRCRPAPGAAPS